MTKATKFISGIELEYVSGSFTGLIKIPNKNKEIEKENIADASKLITFIHKKLKGYFTLSSLFNAYQEEKDGKLINDNDRFNHTSLYADSGGLQVITAGKTINDEVKEKVYKTQAMYCDYAMTFDEMPVKIVKELATGSVAGADGQVFIDELISISAKKSAKHIQKQIDMFEELKTNTKIMPILHGYSGETFIEYAQTILNELHHIGDHIQGVAIASLRGHADNKVGMMKVFDYVPKVINSEKIPSEYKKHVHLLGVGAHQRLLPALMMVKKGILPIEKLSFDSTKIMKSYTYGKVFQSVEELINPKNFNPVLTLKKYDDKTQPNIKQFYENVHNLFFDYDDYVFSDWEDLAKHSQNNGEPITMGKQFEKYGVEYERKYLSQVRYATMYHIYTFLSVCEAYLDDELTIENIMGYNDSILHIFQKFDSVSTHEQFAEVCDYFYTTAKTGRTDLRIVKCKTLKEFEERFEHNRVDSYLELGIEKDVEILNEELKKPWIKTSMKRAKVVDYSNEIHPSDGLF
jgi:hypothetical protein